MGSLDSGQWAIAFECAGREDGRHELGVSDRSRRAAVSLLAEYDRGDCDDYGDDNRDNYCADSDMPGCRLLYVPLRLDSCDSGSDLAGRGRCRHPDLHFREHWIERPR